MLRFLRGPLFEPLSSCSLRDLTCFWSPWPRLAGLASFRRFLAMSLSLALTFICLTFWNFGQRHSLRSIRFLDPFVFGRWRILLVTFRRNFYFVLFVLFVFISLVSLLSLLVLILCLFLLVLLPVLFPRTLLASFFVTSSLTPILLPLPLLLGLLPLLPPFGLIVCVGLRLLGLFCVTLLSPLSLRLLHGLLHQCLLPFT